MTSGLGERLVRVLTLDAEVFGEVAADTEATGQALGVVIGVAFAEGLGNAFAGGFSGLLVGIADGCLHWALWSVSIHAVARLLGIASDLGALFRALGFAALPFALGAIDGLPWLGVLVWTAKWALAVAAFVLAVRRVLAVETGRALLVCAAGLVVAIFLALPVSWLYPG